MEFEQSDPIALSDNHRKSIATTMFLLEQTLDRSLGRLAEPSAKRVMYDLVNSVPPDLCRRIEGEIAKARMEIQRFRDRFDLPRSEVSAARSIWGEMPVAWEMVEETRSRRLRGYGVLPPGLAEVLDPMLDRLSCLVLGIEKLLLPKPEES